MAKAALVVPFSAGSAQFPGVDQVKYPISWVCASYVPPPPGTAPYALVMLSADQAAIDILTARADCLYICAINEDGSFDTKALAAAERNAARTKVSSMGFTGAQYGLLNAAIQSSQKRDELAEALATKAFFRNIKKKFMTNADLRGAMIGGNGKPVALPQEVEK